MDSLSKNIDLLKSIVYFVSNYTIRKRWPDKAQFIGTPGGLSNEQFSPGNDRFLQIGSPGELAPMISGGQRHDRPE